MFFSLILCFRIILLSALLSFVSKSCEFLSLTMELEMLRACSSFGLDYALQKIPLTRICTQTSLLHLRVSRSDIFEFVSIYYRREKLMVQTTRKAQVPFSLFANCYNFYFPCLTHESQDDKPFSISSFMSLISF